MATPSTSGAQPPAAPVAATAVFAAVDAAAAATNPTPAFIFGGFVVACFALAYIVPLILHYLLVLLDKQHRAQCDEHRRNWPFRTVSHGKAIKRPSLTAKNWRLECVEGRQRWLYVGADKHARKQSWFEQYQLGLSPSPDAVHPPKSAAEALDKGANFLKLLQDRGTGHWPNDYSGPLFLLPGAVFAQYIVANGNIEAMWTAPHREEFRRYIVNTQNADGGWGLHTESHSTMFGTTLNYVALRLLGEPAESQASYDAKSWIRSRGGAVSVPSWGKGWLSIMNLYSWEGMCPVPPEMWFIPQWTTLGMGRVWCHSRVVTMPYGYFYGRRWQCSLTPLLQELRTDLYLEPYASIKWEQQQSNIYPDDVYTPHSGFYKFANFFLKIYERFHIPALRRASLKFCVRHMTYDDTLTDYICLGPVNKCLNMIVCLLEQGPDSEALRRHQERLSDYMWLGPEGLRMNGYNGSQLWDTSFAAQALIATGDLEKHAAALRGAYGYVDVAQVRRDPPSRQEFFHSPTKGCWNFSTRDQAWQVSDCTAEGLRIGVLLRNETNITTDHHIADQRLCDAVDVILALRDTKGFMDYGWASYEEPRSYTYMELLNCAELYKDIMIDYTYAECTSSCVHSLILFHRAIPSYRPHAIAEAISVGVRVIKEKQRPDGSWYGSWGNCFTYGAWLSTEALHQVGETYDTCETLRRACAFLLSKQHGDGGWGEDFNSCVTCEWVEHPDGSQVVNTAWAVMSLIAAGGKTHLAAIEKGIAFIISQQKANGDWEAQRITGVFNGNCAINYPGYKNVMPVWALAKYSRLVAPLAASS